MEHKEKRFTSSLDFLIRYEEEGDDMLSRIVTVDEILISHITLNQSNCLWNEDIHTLPSRCLLDNSTEAPKSITKQTVRHVVNFVLLLQDNVRPHSSQTTPELIESFDGNFGPCTIQPRDCSE
ncbi:hypothetical protein TNCV_4850011 [Trichonephila clavipes]|nr:hypothetical protein TNCV_4850011 [Trichonephila clavipes]